MTNEELQELARLDREGSPAPWQPCPYKMFIFTAGNTAFVAGTDSDDDRSLEIRGVGPKLPMDENHDLIIAARNALPKMLAEIATLRAALAKAEGERDTFGEANVSLHARLSQCAKERGKAEAERDEAQQLIVAHANVLQWGWDGRAERDALIDYGRALIAKGVKL